MNGRYSRQELFAPIGTAGQSKLRASHVLIVGAGALGASSAEMLVRAGVGKLTIADRDYVEWSNLQRQQLYTEEDAMQRMPKAVAAKERLARINSEVVILSHVLDVSVQEIEQLIKGVDVILDASDNFDIRMIINDVAHKYDIPWIYSACVGSYGLGFTVQPGKTPCLNCLLEHVPMGGVTCDTVGIIAPAVQMATSFQVTEALKLLVGDFPSLRNKLVSFDLWKNHHSAVNVDKLKESDCPTCGMERSYPFLDHSNQTKTAVLCGRDTVQIRPPHRLERDLKNLGERLSKQNGRVSWNAHLVSFATGDHRLVFFKDGRVLVHGTRSVAEAKTIYHRYGG